MISEGEKRMNFTKIVAAVAVLAAISAGGAQEAAKAADARDEAKPAKRAENPAAFREAAIARAGGYVARPGSMKGRIAFIDAGSGIGEEELRKVVSALGEKRAKYDVRVEKAEAGTPAAIKAKSGADVAVVVVDDDATPTLLVAPEDHWAAVNVRKVSEGLKGSAVERFRASRCRKEILRAFTFVCGGVASSFDGNILDVSRPAELDLRDEFIPFDKFAVFTKHLSGIGVMPRRLATYKRACKEGWAPTPTNEVQKAIWDEVRQLPSKPIKIEFDPAKGK